MKLLRPLVALGLLLLIVCVGLTWWNTPAKADMAEYAPADSLVYIEANSIVDITNALKQSEVLKPLLPLIAIDSHPSQGWSLSAARAGLGPASAVISSRAQLALIVTNIETTVENDSLRVKPEAALVVETHTSKWRMRGAALAAIQQLAQFAYGSGTCAEAADRIQCADPKSSRKLVAAIEGSVLVIGNSEKAVQECVDVRQGRRPSLRTDQELAIARANLKADSALSFGYVSQSNSGRLVKLAIPLMLGRAPTENKLEELLNRSAEKILRGIAWTSRSSGGAIEDRYTIGLEPQVIRNLEPAFATKAGPEDFWKLVPDAFRSVTVYRSNDPESAWSSLNSALAVKLDAVTSVFAAALLRSGLATYNLDNPREALQNLSSPVITFRPILGEDSLLIGRVKNEQELRKLLVTTFSTGGRGQIVSGRTPELSKEAEFTALFVDGFVVLGKTESVRVYLAQLQNNEMVSSEHLKILQLNNREDDAAIVTYSNDTPTLNSVINALAKFSGQPLTETQMSAILQKLDKQLASTESTLSSNGIERRTQSAFGQFGNLISLAGSDTSQQSR